MTQPEQKPEPFIPIEDVAKHFTVSVSTVRAWLRQGYIPRETYMKLGNTYRFQLSKVVEALTKPESSAADKSSPAQMELDLVHPDNDL
jgi:excisionase family DNA binding protein